MTALIRDSEQPDGAGSGVPVSKWLQAAARFRQGAYRLLAETFRPPTREFIRIAPGAAAVLVGMGEDVCTLAFYPPVETWLGELESLQPGSVARLRGQYESIFGDPAAGGRIGLVESDYRRQDASDPGYVIATLRSLYSHAGFGFAEAGGNPADHVSVELEFASLMCREEAGAWANGEGRMAMRVLVRQQLFLSQHMCMWLPLLTRAVDARGNGLYAAAARAAWAVVAHDVDFVRVSRAVAREAASAWQGADAS